MLKKFIAIVVEVNLPTVRIHRLINAALLKQLIGKNIKVQMNFA